METAVEAIEGAGIVEHLIRVHYYAGKGVTPCGFHPAIYEGWQVYYLTDEFRKVTCLNCIKAMCRANRSLVLNQVQKTLLEGSLP